MNATSEDCGIRYFVDTSREELFEDLGIHWKPNEEHDFIILKRFVDYLFHSFLLPDSFRAYTYSLCKSMGCSINLSGDYRGNLEISERRYHLFKKVI